VTSEASAVTLITPEAVTELRRALEDPSIKSGNFQLVFDGESTAAKIMTWIYRHLRLIGLCYGDSGYFVRTDSLHPETAQRPHHG
jgi:hypothetical protein